ncbi:MAG TPA: rhomboid family intramembrane serine protease [Ignavibacteria bacterium]
MSNGFGTKPGLFGFSLFPPVIKNLLLANIGVFLFYNLFSMQFTIGGVPLYSLITQYCSLGPVTPVMFKDELNLVYKIKFFPYFWQIITYMFMHGSFWHLFFNMFALWMFGIELENLWGSKKFGYYYLLCGLGAAVANLFIAPLFSSPGPTIGASGAVFGILVAFGYLFPDRYIYIYFFLPIKAKYFVLIYMGLELFSAVTAQNSNIAHVAHLGGAVVGIIYLFATRKNKMSYFKSGSSSGFNINKFFSGNSSKGADKSSGWFGQKKDETPNYGNKNVQDAKFTEVNNDYPESQNDINRNQDELQVKVDAILDKLSKGGYQSLTDEEKRILFHDSKKLR